MVTLSVDGQSEEICSYSINVGPIQDPPPVVVEPGRPILMCITLLGKDAPFDQEETDSHWGPYLDASIHLCSLSDGARTQVEPGLPFFGDPSVDFVCHAGILRPS